MLAPAFLVSAGVACHRHGTAVTCSATSMLAPDNASQLAAAAGHLDVSSSRRDHRKMRSLAVVAARLAVWVLAAAVACAGCTAAPTGPGAAAKPASSHRMTGSSAAPHLATGGCGGTSIHTGPPPGWNAQPAGFAQQPPLLPYVVGGSDSVMGYLWARQLYAPESHTHSNKVLWYVRYPRDGSPLHVTGHLRADPRRTMSAAFPADSAPGEIYPSDITVPAPGCWSFILRWNHHVDHLNLSFAALPR